ncbi:hypothetical protein ANANG_G00296870 [Anguilla anguilla]|uniref:CCN TSP1 domain-containing protein n=1 Tax=Anguilla anguilla TaxID=7936 RepID=A0A9D3LL25_ANGAN|nr:hypothetical protein ANANG_G00296870 [Anguilla anguilla]
MDKFIFWAVFTMATVGSVRSSCPTVCTCPAAPVSCPRGERRAGRVRLLQGAPGHALLPAPPRLAKVPGQCCPRVHCHKGAPAPSPTRPRASPFAFPYPYKPHKSLSNELLEAGKKWDKMSRYKHLAAWRQVGVQCVVQTTSWSPCSRSCGMGVSSRVSNDNGQCKLTKETRLCNIRPCSSLQPLPRYRPRLLNHTSLQPLPLKKGKKCSRMHKAPEPLRLSHAGCRGARLYRPSYCGVCVDGRCCSPAHPHRRRDVRLPRRRALPEGRHVRAVLRVQGRVRAPQRGGAAPSAGSTGTRTSSPTKAPPPPLQPSKPPPPSSSHPSRFGPVSPEWTLPWEVRFGEEKGVDQPLA